MLTLRIRRTFFVTLLLFTLPTLADEVTLDDGSLLKGRIVQIAGDRLTLETDYAGELHISTERIRRLITTDQRRIRLDDGRLVTGRLTLSEDGEQLISGTALGIIALEGRRITALWDPEAPRPPAGEDPAGQIAAGEEAGEQRKVAGTTDAEQLGEQHASWFDPWSGSVSLGLLGSQGNTENFGLKARGELLRETDVQRLALHLQSNYQEQGGVETAKEFLGWVSLEHDITRRWFTFGKAEFERDKFENLDLRALGTAGLGYFFVREKRFELKGLGGLGYQHENFSDGTTQGSPLGSLGYALRYDANSWLRILHDTTYLPEFEDPGNDFRVVSNLAGEMPLAGEDSAWKLRTGVRNQYDNQPAAGADNLDTTYYLDLLYGWK